MPQLDQSLTKPTAIKVLNAFYFILSVLSIMRIIQAITQWNYLLELNVSPHPIYFFLSGFLWALSNGINTIGLFQQKPWIILYTKINGVIICLWLWVEYLLLTESGDKANLPFLSILSIIWIAYNLFIFKLPRVHNYYKIGQSKNDRS